MAEALSRQNDGRMRLMKEIEIGDVVTFNFVYQDHPSGTPFTATEIDGNYPCRINGRPAHLRWKFRKLDEAELVCYQVWKASGETLCFSLREKVKA